MDNNETLDKQAKSLKAAKKEFEQQDFNDYYKACGTVVRYLAGGLAEGTEKTPARFGKMLQDMTEGYFKSAKEIIEEGGFKSSTSGMVIVDNIDFYSLCEHHLAPFFGKVHIGYLPEGKVLGLSKTARVVEVYAKRLQMQEVMTEQIANDLMQYIPGCKGVIVVIKAQHLCMAMRGVKQANAVTTTSEVRGLFKESISVKEEFFSLLGAI